MDETTREEVSSSKAWNKFFLEVGRVIMLESYFRCMMESEKKLK